MRLFLDDKTLTQHMAVIGSSGEGKSTFLESMVYQQLRRGGGLCYMDAKLDYSTADNLYALCKHTNRLDDLRIINIDDPSFSHSYNPFLSGDADETASMIMNLFQDTKDASVQFYRDMYLFGLTTVIAAIKKSGMAYNILDLSILFSRLEALEYLASITPSGEERLNLNNFINMQVDKKGNPALLDYFKALGAKLFIYAQGNIGSVFNAYMPEVNLFDSIMKNHIILIMLPTMGKSAIALSMARAILSDIRSAIYHVQSESIKPVIPFLLLMDEFNRYALPELASILFEQARSAKVVCIPAFQTILGDMMDLYSVVFSNTASKVFFRVGDFGTARQLSDIIGQEIKLFDSQSRGTKYDPFQPVKFLFKQKTEGKSEKYDYTVRPETLQGLDIGEAVVIVRNQIYKCKMPMVQMGDDLKVKGKMHLTRIQPPFRKGLNLRDRFGDLS